MWTEQRRILPSRLFWKLFAAFTLATGTSFLVGIQLVIWGTPTTRAPQAPFETSFRIAHVIQDEGLAAALPLLRQEQASGEVALFLLNGKWVAGARTVRSPSTRMDLTSPNGERFRLLAGPPEAIQPNRAAPLILGAFVSLFFSVAVAWYLARPLTLLSRGFRAAAAGEFKTRVHPLVGKRRDEIADLTCEFDSMADQLEHLQVAQERLLHDISHELRSPLARLYVAIGLLQQAPERLPAMLGRVEREAHRLDMLIEQLLALARLKARTPDLPATSVDVIDLISAIVDDANFEARGKPCRVIFHANGSFVTAAHEELLYRAFENIIRNAIKFSSVDGTVSVELSDEGDLLTARVRDNGPGVPAEALSQIFEPFKRYDQNDGSTASGFGLGLAIAKQAVEHHGGSIRAIANPSGKGLEVEVKIPQDMKKNRS